MFANQSCEYIKETWKTNPILPGEAPGSEHLLQKCVLHGKEVDCAKLFKPVPTDTGICCAFNNKNVLRDSEYSRLLRRRQSEDKILDGDDEEEDEEHIHRAEIGVKKGLQVFIDQHSNRVTAGSVLSTSK